MELYIGGFAQGKLDYVKTVHADEKLCVAEDYRELPGSGKDRDGRLVVYGMHRMIREMLAEGMDPHTVFEELFSREPDCIVICDEVGNGIVPIEPEERTYRDAVGEELIRTAQKADRVERVLCGLGQRIK